MGRKISSLIELWGRKYKVFAFFGGDILPSSTQKDASFGNAKVHGQSYRKSEILAPLVHSVSEIRDIIHNIQSFYFLKNTYKNEKLDLVWERSSRLHFAGLIFAKKYNIPYVLEWKDHLVNYRFSALKPIALYFERYKCEKADKIVVESKVLKDDLTAQGINPDKIVVAHNASDSSVFIRDENRCAAYRKSLGIDADVILIGYLGSYAF
ncbi:MAG: glycosyltransferase, partial [Planctomycetota bacterium]